MGLVSHGLVAIPRTVNGGIEPNGFHYAGALVSIHRINLGGDVTDLVFLCGHFPELPPAFNLGLHYAQIM